MSEGPRGRAWMAIAIAAVVSCGGSPSPALPLLRAKPKREVPVCEGLVCAADCDRGVASSCVELARTELAEEVADPSAIAAHAKRACDGGALDGCALLGKLVLLGKGATRDVPFALALFRAACDGGDPSGCGLYGNLVENARPMFGDVDRALEAYEEGCARDDARSCSSLDRLRPAAPRARMKGPVCDDPIAGVWFGEAQRQRQKDWYDFEVTIERVDASGSALMGVILTHFWYGDEHSPVLSLCAKDDYDAVVRMPARGEAKGDEVRFDGYTFLYVGLVCGDHYDRYNVDGFVGNLVGAGTVDSVWHDALGAAQSSVVLRRERCLSGTPSREATSRLLW